MLSEYRLVRCLESTATPVNRFWAALRFLNNSVFVSCATRAYIPTVVCAKDSVGRDLAIRISYEKKLMGVAVEKCRETSSNTCSIRVNLLCPQAWYIVVYPGSLKTLDLTATEINAAR